jgi:hypothetical protein
MFIAALFTIAKLWKQPRCPSTEKNFKKLKNKKKEEAPIHQVYVHLMSTMARRNCALLGP